jgi:hypothetical protein
VSAENEVQRTPEQLANYLDAYCGFDPKSMFHACVHEAAALIRNLQSSLAEKDETIAELRARCEAAERDAVYFVTHLAEFIRGLTEDDQETYLWLDRRSALLSQADAFIAAQHAQRKEKGL